MDRAGLDAMPIVCTLSFFVGAVVALIGANLLAQFGATVFIVELIGVAVLREFGVLITAILLAGRSASSFAAEIGSMRMNQEIDAMEVIGVDPYEALVAPRLIALLIMTPAADPGRRDRGLLGGIAVAWVGAAAQPGLLPGPDRHQRGRDPVPDRHGQGARVRVVIASIGCRQGLQVEGDVESLGLRVTTAVVQAIFAIIVIDAAFALIFMELNV
jgi:phospholipid/cholesterol/gamma-HCH transport system permease protein